MLSLSNCIHPSVFENMHDFDKDGEVQLNCQTRFNSESNRTISLYHYPIKEKWNTSLTIWSKNRQAVAKFKPLNNYGLNYHLAFKRM